MPNDTPYKVKDGHVTYSLPEVAMGSFSFVFEKKCEGTGKNHDTTRLTVEGDTLTFDHDRQFGSTYDADPALTVTSPLAASLLREKVKEVKADQTLSLEEAERFSELCVKLRSMSVNTYDEHELQFIRDYRIADAGPQR